MESECTSETLVPGMTALREHATQRRADLRLAAGLLALIVGTVFGLVTLQRALLFPRPRVAVAAPPPNTEDFEAWWIESPEGPVEAWFLRGRNVTGPSPVVLFTHGNGELIDFWRDEMNPWLDMGVSVVLAEYRGYGRSAGSPSEAHIAADLRLLHAKMVAHPLIDPARIVYHGRSLGGGAVGTLLRSHAPRALILESTFTSVTDLVAAMRLPRSLMVDRFETLPALAEYNGPLLVVHGEHDRVIPVAHGRRLAQARPGSELLLYDCGHNDLPHDARYWQTMRTFLERANVL